MNPKPPAKTRLPAQLFSKAPTDPLEGKGEPTGNRSASGPTEARRTALGNRQQIVAAPIISKLLHIRPVLFSKQINVQSGY
jgi:hypothetical protein